MSFLLPALITLACLLASVRCALETHASSAAHSQRSTESEISGPGYYVVQFRSSINSAILRRLEAVLGYEPTDYVPTNSLVLWLDSAEQGELLLSSTPQIRWIGPLESKERRVDFASIIKNIKMQYERFQPVRANSSSTFASLADNGKEAFRVPFSTYEHDDGGSGGVVFRLRILARHLDPASVQSEAQSACRTRVQLRLDTTVRRGGGLAVSRGDDEDADEDGETKKESDSEIGRGDRIYELANVHCDDAPLVAEMLSLQTNVRWIELRTPMHIANRWAIPSMHTSRGGDQRNHAPFVLRGANQLLSMSDTGVSVNTCFFRDTAPVPFTSVQRVPVQSKPVHAHIAAYWSGSGGDFLDKGHDAGHGTHVAGTALGAGAGEMREYSGGAPEARLVFIDLSPATSSNGFLEIPLDIGTTLLQWSYDCGARVHSASWGGDAGGAYTTDEQAIDRFMYKNRNFLVIFAAGNAGPISPSITSPAMAKNALTVGAVMNGVESVRQAQTPSRPADDYTSDWLASFSSRGSANLAVRKPDIVAPGSLVSSANNDAPADGACAPLSSCRAILQGTSMATPVVSAAAVLIREYFITGRYPNRASIANIDTSQPTASLVRAVLVSSAQPLRGIYPRQPFTSVQQRIDASGHGRIALDQVLDGAYAESSSVTLAVLSNEDQRLALAPQAFRRWCIRVTGPYDQLVIALAYADYPSLPMAKTTIINDLRLRVADGETNVEMTINDQPKKNEKRSTIERAIVYNGTRTVNVAVIADALGFGDVETYSLVAVLVHGSGASSATSKARLIVAGPTTDSTCLSCPLMQDQFLPGGLCPICGDGVVNSAVEECDSVACCSTVTCKWINDSSPCSVIAGDCRLAGVCRGRNGCSVDGTTMYGVKDAGGSGSMCQIVHKPSPPAARTCVFLSSTSWAARLDSIGAERELCCAPLRGVFDGIEFDHLFAALAREYAAALLNSVQEGALIDAANLLLIERARELLESRCGVGFLTVADRHAASLTHNDLRVLNEHCGDVTAIDKPSTCSLSALEKRLCSDGGVYDQQGGFCVCDADRQQAEPDCAHLACSGNGISVFDYDVDTQQCACFEGWTGIDCSQCAVFAAPLPIAYHCVGVPLSLNATQIHFLTIVLRSSVDARLSGTFYIGSPTKYADAVPGESGLDCWCRLPKERIVWRSMLSHFDVVTATHQQRVQMLAIQARSDAVLVVNRTVEAVSPSKPVATATASNDSGRRSRIAMLAILFAGGLAHSLIEII